MSQMGIIKPTGTWHGSILPRKKRGVGTHIQTGNRIDLCPPENNDDPKVKVWLSPWFLEEEIPICDLDSFIIGLIEYREERLQHG